MGCCCSKQKKHEISLLSSSSGDTKLTFSVNKKDFTFDDFTDDDKLGGGVQGTVFKAQWRKNHLDSETVAVKVFGRSEEEATFINEYLLLSQTRHDHVLKLRGLSAEKPYWIITDYYPSGSLKDFILQMKVRCEFLTVPQRVSLATQIGDGLRYFFEHNILHTDLADRNILIEQIGTGATSVLLATIGDFGNVESIQDETQFRAASANDVERFGVLLHDLATDNVIIASQKEQDAVKRLVSLSQTCKVTSKSERPMLPGVYATLEKIHYDLIGTYISSKKTYASVTQISQAGKADIIVLGAAGVGKTRLMEQLGIGKIETSEDIELITCQNIKITAINSITDEKFSNWLASASGNKLGIVVVVDSTNKDLTEPIKMYELCVKRLSGRVPAIIFANQKGNQVMSEGEIERNFLKSFRQRRFKIQEIQHQTFIGLEDGINWMLEQLLQ